MKEIRGKKKDNIIIYIIILCSLFFFMCNGDKSSKQVTIESKYGVAFNPVRGILGLVPFDRKWESCKPVRQRNLLRIDWLSKNKYVIILNQNKSTYWSKSIWIEFNMLIKEADSYILTEYIDSGGKKASEKCKTLSYFYHFVPDNYYSVGWSYYYITNSNEKVYGGITKREADSILNSWGLSRTQSQ